MLKEIHEQPATIVDTLNGLLDRAHTDPFPLAQQPAVTILESAKELTLIACGTSWHAAMVGKYWLEKLARIPVSVELASEFKYRDPVLKPGTLVVAVSQSGETADTLAAIRQVRSQADQDPGHHQRAGQHDFARSGRGFLHFGGPGDRCRRDQDFHRADARDFLARGLSGVQALRRQQRRAARR